MITGIMKALFVILLVASAFPLSSYGAVMNDYCQAPPFISSSTPPNIMLLIDASGSMGQLAYQTRREGDDHRYCSNNPSMQCHENNDCSHNYCSGQPSRDCEDNHDCSHDDHHYGTCVAPSPATGTCDAPSSASTPYGYCSNSVTTECEVDSECSALASCTLANQPCVCQPRMVFEGYFDPNKGYFLDATDSTYYEETAGATCTTKYTYLCKTSGGSGCGALDARPADALNICAPGRYYCNRGSQTYAYTCRSSSSCSGGTLTTAPATPQDAYFESSANICPSSGSKYYCTRNRTSKPTSYSTGDCGTEYSGNLLNYRKMRRTDLLRWAMTGGRPSSCGSSGGTASNSYCDPRMYQQASGHVNCSDTQKINTTNTRQGGCVLQADDGTLIASPWERVQSGLAFEFSRLSTQPRMGAMVYPSPSNNTNVRDTKVYVGDFTGPTSTSPYPFTNLVALVNSEDPSGYTPSGPAMWDAFHYFAQVSPTHNGIDPSPNIDASKWKNPMYDCADGQSGSNCKLYTCTKNFVLLMSDGLWNKASCNISDNIDTDSPDPVVPAYLMHKGFVNTKTSGTPATKVTSVYTVGLFVSTEGQKALENTAIYGSFDYNATSQPWPSNRTNYPGIQSGDPASCTLTSSQHGCTGTVKGSLCNAVPASSADWDKNGDGVADTFFYAEDALEIKNKLLTAVLEMLARASSGTAASVLASGEGSGANIVQSIFYPRRTIVEGQPNIMWTSTLQNLWYYLDPKTSNSSIRENTGDSGATKELTLTQDSIVNYWFDTDEQVTKAKLFADANGDGLKDSTDPASTVNADTLRYLWEAGSMLWSKSAADRKIFANVANTATMTEFTETNLATTSPTIQSLLNTDVGTRSSTDNEQVARNTIKFARGEEVTTNTVGLVYRTRKTALVPSGTQNVWKLGDIINSTPRIASWIALNNYDKSYGDSTYTEFVSTAGYRARGTVFAGANDGMLHAFKLGSLTLFNETYKKAELQGTNLGAESWAFIPKNALPYLQYLGTEDYCHLYYVDATPVIFDASIGRTGCSSTNYWDCTKTASTWRTILIGGMRLGGSCKPSSYTGSFGVNEPASGMGYSSYFALDLTDSLAYPDDPVNHPPKLLWEFAPTDGSLGFTTSGPAIVRINARSVSGGTSTADKNKNGRWFAVFASGPTGPIDTTAHQFKGYSDQPLKLFILDLEGPGSGGTWTQNTNYWVKTPSGFNNAFGSSLYNGNIDYDMDYQDDVLYLGYTKSEKTTPDATTYWTDGGILRMVTREDLAGISTSTTALDPTNWEVSTVRGSLGPVSASVGHLAHYATKTALPDIAYLYAGTGRYYFNNASASDDASSQRAIYGITEPCLADILNNVSCSTASTATLGNATSSAAGTDPTTYPAGWYINLDAATSDVAAERVITDPLAAPTGAVFFTTTAPSNNVCEFGGRSYLWAVKYDTGGAVASYLKGVGLLQVSTGAIEEVNLQSDFGSATDATHKYGRRSDSLEGIPPIGQGLSLVMPPKPLDKILHMRKK